jgi:hypothetical protein
VFGQAVWRPLVASRAAFTPPLANACALNNGLFGGERRGVGIRVHESHRGALVHHTGEVERIPVGQADEPCDSVLPILSGSGVPWMPYEGAVRSIQTRPTGLFGPGLMVSGSLVFTPFQANFGL